MSLPDRPRPGLLPPARVLASSLARAAVATTWRLANPAERGPYLETGRPAPLVRLYYESFDGWRAPVFHLPAAPGSPGEPVLLAHALGVGSDGFRYGGGATLAGRLSRAGFSVYLLAHRGDRDALPPDRAAPFSFDDIVEQDVPAALERVVAHAGFPRVHWVGHGLGGQLGLAWVARDGEHVASMAAIGAPVAFERRDDRRDALLELVPASWSLPTRTLARLSAPLATDRDTGLHRAGAAPGPRVRGLLHHASEDLPVGLLRQLATWAREGRLVDVTGLYDYVEGLVSARVPLLAAAGLGDGLCPPARARPAVAAWGHPDVTWVELPPAWGHADALVADDADRGLIAPLVAWLHDRRRLSWTPDGREAGVGRSG